MKILIALVLFSGVACAQSTPLTGVWRIVGASPPGQVLNTPLR